MALSRQRLSLIGLKGDMLSSPSLGMLHPLTFVLFWPTTAGPVTKTNKFKLYHDFTRGRSDVLPSFLLQVKISKAKKNSDLFLSGDRLFTELQSHLCLVNSWIEQIESQPQAGANAQYLFTIGVSYVRGNITLLTL